MPKKYSRTCDHCGKEYTGYGDCFCSRTCCFQHPYSLERTQKAVESRKGYRHSEETKKKISMAHTGKTHEGKPHTQETKRKISIAKKGKSHSSKPCSEETKRKISTALTTPIEERFWSKVDIRGDDECWEWLAGKDKNGYGIIQLNGRSVKAHRIAYLLRYGLIDNNLLVCHKCNNRSCENPAHLYQGTPQDNATDRVNADKHPKGERNYSAKLAEQQVIKIIELLKNGKSHKFIAEAYKVSKGAIRNINKMKSWKYLPR